MADIITLIVTGKIHPVDKNESEVGLRQYLLSEKASWVLRPQSRILGSLLGNTEKRPKKQSLAFK